VRLGLRQTADKLFTALTILAVAAIAAALGIILLPILARGSRAVVFRGTIEFRKLEFDMHKRGSETDLRAELSASDEARKPVYELLDRFESVVETSGMEKEARDVYDAIAKDLERENVASDRKLALRRMARRQRNSLWEAFRGEDKAEAMKALDAVLALKIEGGMKAELWDKFHQLADRYRKTLNEADIARRNEYRRSLRDVSEGVRKLLGPRPGAKQPVLAENRYGATRWEQAIEMLDDIVDSEQWVFQGPGKPLVKERVSREKVFAGTSLEPLFGILRKNLGSMLRPRQAFYWQYFIDDSTPGHFLGGVGPEILGTLILTVLSILLALPLGIIAAAYLVEVAGENAPANFIRMCINTLAGVPSIVFGLFGMAFIVLWLLPRFGLASQPCVLSAALTLAILILPIIIRASEEAIRAVPAAYKEAALALGAGRLRCFLTVQLPVALPGILTGVILAMSRAAGETAPILFTGAVALGPALKLFGRPLGGWLFSPTRALSYGSYDIAVSDRVAMTAPYQQYGMVITLIGLVVILNLAAILLRFHVSRKLRGR